MLTSRVDETHIAELANDLPHATLVKTLNNTPILFQEERQGSQAHLRLYVQLPVLLPRIDELDHMRMRSGRRAGQVPKHIDFFEVSQSSHEPKQSRSTRHIPRFDAVKQPSGFLDRPDTLAIPVLNSENSAKLPLAQRLERNKPLLEEILLFNFRSWTCRMGLSMMQCLVHFGSRKSGQR